MTLYDITRPLSAAPLYPGTEPTKIERVSDMGEGAFFNESVITAASHLGTHADAPLHMIRNGAPIDETPLECYFGACRLASFEGEALISKAEIETAFGSCERMALRTGGARYLSLEAAEAIAASGARAVLTDALSVAPPDDEAPVHLALLSAGVAIIENCDFSAAPDGNYILSAFPVKYDGCDGAPVRAVLIAD